MTFAHTQECITPTPGTPCNCRCHRGRGGNHDEETVVIVSEWLDTLTPRQGWGVVLRFAWRRVWHGQDRANEWLLLSALDGLAERW